MCTLGILLLVLASLMWSFVGTLVKLSSQIASPEIITLSRFLFGVVFLAAYMLITKKKITFSMCSKWIWIGAAAKCCNYIFENIALSTGKSYGNIIGAPIQTILMIFISALYFKDKISKKQWAAMILCVVGILFISWNGLPLKEIIDAGFALNLLYAISAVGVSFHVLSQKLLIDTMDSGNMNLNMFIISTAIVSVPAATSGHIEGFNLLSVFALLSLGFITGISFYIYANALKKVTLGVGAIIMNSSFFFTLLWGKLFFDEKITVYIILGSIIFVTGIIMLSIPEQYRFKWRRAYEVEVQ